MRRDLSEIENEIMRRRDEYRAEKAKRARIAKAAIPSACAAVLALTLVFAWPALKNRKAGSSNAVPGNNLEYYASGSDNKDGETAPAQTETTNAPTATGEPGLSGGDHYSAPGPWLCGTPVLEGQDLSSAAFMNRDTALTLVRTTVAFAGEEVERFFFDGEDGGPVLRLIRGAIDGSEAQAGAIDPDSLDCDLMTYFEFMNEKGELLHIGVCFTADGLVYFNSETVCRTVADPDALRSALRALCES